MWKCPYVHCMNPVFLVRELFLYGYQPCFSSECAGCYLLDSGCDWCCGVQSLHWMLDGQGLLFSLWLSQSSWGWDLLSGFSVEALSHVW